MNASQKPRVYLCSRFVLVNRKARWVLSELVNVKYDTFFVWGFCDRSVNGADAGESPECFGAGGGGDGNGPRLCERG